MKIWNVNGTVKADRPSNFNGALNVQDLSNYQGYQIAREFDSKSAMYDMLRNKLHIGKQNIALNSFVDAPPIVTPSGITLIPLRATADRLELNMMLSASKVYTFYDDATRTQITLKNGSNQAVVNGKTVTWSQPFVIIKNTAYVPARDLTKPIGATLAWIPSNIGRL